MPGLSGFTFFVVFAHLHFHNSKQQQQHPIVQTHRLLFQCLLSSEGTLFYIRFIAFGAEKYSASSLGSCQCVVVFSFLIFSHFTFHFAASFCSGLGVFFFFFVFFVPSTLQYTRRSVSNLHLFFSLLLYTLHILVFSFSMLSCLLRCADELSKCV